MLSIAGGATCFPLLPYDYSVSQLCPCSDFHSQLSSWMCFEGHADRRTTVDHAELLLCPTGQRDVDFETVTDQCRSDHVTAEVHVVVVVCCFMADREPRRQRFSGQQAAEMIRPTNSLSTAIRLCEISAAISSSSEKSSWRISVGMGDLLGGSGGARSHDGTRPSCQGPKSGLEGIAFRQSALLYLKRRGCRTGSSRPQL